MNADERREEETPAAPRDEAPGAGSAALPPERRREIEERVIEVLKSVYDPEIPVDIYELGLVYELDVMADGHVIVRMTLTSPACPVAESLPGEVEMRVGGVEGVTGVDIDLVWDPPWDPSKMTEAARLQLGLM